MVSLLWLRPLPMPQPKIGQSPDEGTLGNWMREDFNQNGKIDGPYDSYLEDNSDKPVGDFQLMKYIGSKFHPALSSPLKKSIRNCSGIYTTPTG